MEVFVVEVLCWCLWWWEVKECFIDMFMVEEGGFERFVGEFVMGVLERIVKSF